MSKIMVEAGKKAAATRRRNEKQVQRKRKEAADKAAKKGKEAVTFTKVRLNKLGWKYAEFCSRKKNPIQGIVDLIAVKLDKHDKSTVNVILFQVKGGLYNRVSDVEKVKLEKAVKKVRIAFNCAEKQKRHVEFAWEPTDELFDSHCYSCDGS